MFYQCLTFIDKKVSGKPKEELGEKKHEIDKRIDVSGQLSTKKGKKGNLFDPLLFLICKLFVCIYHLVLMYCDTQTDIKLMSEFS